MDLAIKDNNIKSEIITMERIKRDIETAKNYLRDVGFSQNLVTDGMYGIRADYDKEDDKLKIWFTNGFDNPDNEIVIKVKKWLKENYS